MNNELIKTAAPKPLLAKRRTGAIAASGITGRVSKAMSLRMAAHDRRVEAAEAKKAKAAEVQKAKAEAKSRAM